MKKAKSTPSSVSIVEKTTKTRGKQKPPKHRTLRTKLPTKFTRPASTNVFVLSDLEWEQLELRRSFDKGPSLTDVNRKMIESSVNGFCLAVSSGLSRSGLKQTLVKITKSMASIRQSVNNLSAMLEINDQILVNEIFGTGFIIHDVDQDFFKAYQAIDETFMGCLAGLPKTKKGPKTDFLIPLFETLLQDLMMFSSKALISRSDVDRRAKVSDRLMTDPQFFECLFELITSRINIPFKRTSIDHAYKMAISNHLQWQRKQRQKAKSEGTKSEF